MLYPNKTRRPSPQAAAPAWYTRTNVGAYPLQVPCARPPPGAAGPCIRYTEAFRLTRDGAPYGAGPPDVVRENRCRGAQCAPGLLQYGGPDRTGAQYPQGVRRIRKRQSRQRLRCVRPYNRCRQPRRHLPHRASEATIKSRRQVEATQAERQRLPTAWLKTRGRSPVPSARREPPPRPKLRSKLMHLSTEIASAS